MNNTNTANFDLNYLKAHGCTHEQLQKDGELCARVMEALLPPISRQMSYMNSLLQQLGLEPQDAAQEFLLKVLASETLFNAALSTAQPLAYLQRSAKNMLLDMEKKRHIDTAPLEVDGKINIADSSNFERDIINKADAAAALHELNNYDEFDAICFLACRYFGIKPQQLAQSLRRHGFHALARATVKSAGNSFAPENLPLLRDLQQRCLQNDRDFSHYEQKALAKLITHRCTDLKDKLCRRLA